MWGYGGAGGGLGSVKGSISVSQASESETIPVKQDPVVEVSSSTAEVEISVKPGDRLVWLNFGRFTNELIVARLEDGNLFKQVSEVLRLNLRTKLDGLPSVGEVQVDPLLFCSYC